MAGFKPFEKTKGDKEKTGPKEVPKMGAKMDKMPMKPAAKGPTKRGAY